jgi:hypothetical protein
VAGATAGEADADLRTRDGSLGLFSTRSVFDGAPVVEARVAVPLRGRFGVEVRVGVMRPILRTHVTGDAEGAPSIDLVEQVDQYAFEGALTMAFDRLRLGRLIPFATAGAGYLRQLHEGQTLVEHGVVYHAGGGVKNWLFSRPGFVNAVGLRGEGRLSLLSGGISIDGGVRPHVGVLGSVFVVF